MNKSEAQIGVRVRSNVDFAGVPAGTAGVIDEEYSYNVGGEQGWMVAWDLPERPLPEGYKEFDGKTALQSNILRDGFSEKELVYLDVVKPEEPKT